MNQRLLLLLCALSSLAIGHVGCSSAARDERKLAPIVDLPGQGKVIGISQPVDNNGTVYLYQGIRYAQAKRFAPPSAVPAWSGVYEATDWREQCPQPIILPQTLNGSLVVTNSTSEDCLFLNIWKPEGASETKKKPVMVFIHGGTFLMGTVFALAMDGRYMAHRGDVLLVTIQFRLGALGLLTDFDRIPTNLALLDQLFALKWLNKNIHHFGGDSKLVTIFGESSGAMNVGHLLLSPLAKGLFQRSIIQSGSPFSYYGILSPEKALEKTKVFARRLGCPVESAASKLDNKTIACLKEKPVEAFINATLAFVVHHEQPFLPTYGRSSEVMPLSPVEAIKARKFNSAVDVLYGVCNNEGSHFVLNFAPELANPSVPSGLTVSSVRAKIFAAMSSYNLSFAGEIADFYTSPLAHRANVSQGDLKIAFANALGDYHLICPTVLFGEELEAASDQHSTYYSYRLEQHMTDPLLPLPYQNWFGILHGEDLNYLFSIPFQHKAEERELSADMIRAWTTFARTGHPSQMGNTQWSSALDKAIGQQRSTRFMYLKARNYRMVDNFTKANCDGFWKSKIVK